MERDSGAAPGAPHIPRLQNGKYRGDFAPPPVVAPFKLDEGYSDETRSQAENDVIQVPDDALSLPGWILAHSEADRAEFAYSLLRTLRTSTVAAVVDRLTPLLHMDPVLKLPPEITAEIFAYLDPYTLLTATLASKSWRARILDSRLWRQLYIQDGWGFDVDAIEKFEEKRSKAMLAQNRKSRTRQSDTDMGQPKLKKRVPPSWIDSRRNSRPETNTMTDASPPWNEQHGTVEADGTSNTEARHTPDAEGDHEMRDAGYDDEGMGSPTAPRRALERRSFLHSRKSSLADSSRRFMPFGTSSMDYMSQIRPTLLTKQPNGTAKLNWTYLYKQRRRLEENWRKGRFTNFQLPDPSHPSEAHSECVYAIQFSGKWLVSGSRDKTVRVWDLETRRLRGTPLIGHSKSVLCLQFDPSEKEDIIVSGSSDKNVIIWRFSTGEKIQQLTNAHQDSVLNLRFDERFLVTCSKDKLIKVWNRRELSPTDKNYPTFFKGSGVRYPSHIIDTSLVTPSGLEAQIANRQVRILPPYSLLMTLDGHGAAVNAIQIDENEIVSASGDRLIKVWDIHTGACLKTLIGHQKGIACVQFDSRRIVSGSNDDTVRIYDHASGAEVACLHGHQDLVRTVQAGFGDPPGAEETLRLEAMAVDTEFWEAQRRGEVPDLSSAVNRRRRLNPTRSTGSRRPTDIMALGAKIPPGGGGSAWGRIVSGSYDETIIIWKKDLEGKWVVGQRLRQDEAARAASADGASDRAFLSGRDPPQQPLPGPQNNTVPLHQQPMPNAPADNTFQTGMAPTQAPPQQVPTQLAPNAAQPLGQGVLNPQHPNIPPGLYPPMVLPQAHAQLQGPNRPFPHPGSHPTARVFKLQFDARKLICASQDQRIVGWDFACGDEEIEEACRFFVGL
ncbi:hypothetical protein FQN51_003830 [Onygenales sp. PD_10]|nr:hypothetical protein FQN51_003830 [Onygenales sp. PD_10]